MPLFVELVRLVMLHSRQEEEMHKEANLIGRLQNVHDGPSIISQRMKDHSTCIRVWFLECVGIKYMAILSF